MSKKPRRVCRPQAERDSDHFLSGRTPGWSLLPLRGNSPPVPDRKYNSGCKSSAAALCRAQPPKAALGAELCDLYAKGVQIVRAADCNPFVKKGLCPFLTVSKAPAALAPQGQIIFLWERYLTSGFWVEVCSRSWQGRTRWVCPGFFPSMVSISSLPAAMPSASAGWTMVVMEG